MTITKNLIISTAEAYTVEELTAKRKELLDKLAEGEFVQSASTGAGAGYSMGQRAQTEELIELYTAALHYKQFGEIASDATAYQLYFHI